MFVLLGDLRRMIREGLEDDQEAMNDAIEERMREPEYASLEAFAEAKMDDDQETFDAVDLQALARNLYLRENPTLKAKQLSTAPSAYRERVKSELSGYGLKFVPRAKVRDTRGFSSPFHGSNRFAGNHGGTGFDTAFNRSKDNNRVFDPNDSGALGMGSKRKR